MMTGVDWRDWCYQAGLALLGTLVAWVVYHWLTHH